MANVKFSDFTDGSEVQIGDQVVGLRAGVNTRFDFPGTGIKDSAGNYMLAYGTAGGAAVNYVSLLNSLSSNSPVIDVAGTDTNIDLTIDTKGTGAIKLTAPVTDVESLTFFGDAVTVQNILDEDDMSSDSDTALATQQSIKAYVDAQTGGGDNDNEAFSLLLMGG